MTGRRRKDFHRQTVLDLDLRPGDVLLSHGGRRKSRLICMIDGGDYSHASIWDGMRVVEATGSVRRVHRCKLDELVDHTQYVDAFRPTWGGQPLGTHGLSPDPILRIAHSYVDQRYSYGQLYLIGTLLAAGRLLGHPRGKWIFHQIADELAQALRKAEDHGPGDQPMVCSHYVSRCFWEADPTHARRYGLRVRLQPSRFWRGNGPVLRTAPELDRTLLRDWTLDERRAYTDLHARCRRILLGDASPVLSDTAFRDTDDRRSVGVRHIEVKAGSVELPVVSVSPGHLQHSPNLEYLGVLSERRRDKAWRSGDEIL